LALMASLYLL